MIYNNAVLDIVADNNGAGGEEGYPCKGTQPTCAVTEEIPRTCGCTLSLTLLVAFSELRYGYTSKYNLRPTDTGHRPLGNCKTHQSLDNEGSPNETHEELSSARLR